MAQKTKTKPTTDSGAKTHVSRSILFPKEIYNGMEDENTLLDRAGHKENTADTLVNLVADGLKYRKLVRSGSIKA